MNIQHLDLENLGMARGLPKNWLADRPHLFASTEVYMEPSQIQAMQDIIQAIETVISLPAYQLKVLSWAEQIAQFDPKIPGLFRGYDFHVTPQGPKLIEININAGGAAFNALWNMKNNYAQWEQEYFALFAAEWQKVRSGRSLQRIAIVDEQPEQQYFYPEFLLFKKLFNDRGINVLILDPQELRIKNNQLCARGLVIDLVYNRLTDFTFSDSKSQILKQAYLENYAVITPHPRAHALYADKKNLTILTDESALRHWGVSEKIITLLLQAIPPTRIVDPQQADWFWQKRKELFFKPMGKYGGKGVYQGSKITHKVFNQIMQSNYIAQSFIPPSQLKVSLAGKDVLLKMDVRSYVYDGQILGLAARLYQGQTTNFRTEGSGFAKVIPRLKGCFS